MLDLRRRLTAQVIRALDDGRTVVVVGGPGMGKTHLAEAVRRGRSRTVGEDGVKADRLGALSAGAPPTLLTLGVADYDAAYAARSGTLWVPLVNVIPRVFRRHFDDGDARWQASGGHPALAAQTPFPNAEQRARLRDLVHDDPRLSETLSAIYAATASLTPSARYAHVDAASAYPLKPCLDRLACAGLVTRMIHDARPGLWVTPFEPPLFG